MTFREGESYNTVGGAGETRRPIKESGVFSK